MSIHSGLHGRRGRASAVSLLAVLFAIPAADALAARRYHVAPTGSDGADCSESSPCRQIRRVLPLLAPGDTLVAAGGTYQGFTILELHGTAAAPIVITSPGRDAEIQPTTDRGDNQSNVLVSESSYIELDGLRSFRGPSHGVRVSRSAHVTVRNGVFGNHGAQAIFTGHADDLLIEDNECYGSVSSHGIYLSNSGDRPVVRRNRTHDNYKAGIQLNADASEGGDGLITGALIEANVVFNNGVDSAAINLDGVQDSIVKNNLIYNNRGTAIALFRIDGAAGSSGVQVLHNIVDVPVGGRTGLSIKNTVGPNVVRNNILVNRNAASSGLKYGTSADLGNTDSDYNVVDRITPDDGSTVYTLAQWQAQGRERNSLSASPAALWVASAASDYHHAPGSPAVDRGQVLAVVGVDLEGNPRPAGARSDIGAYEAGASVPGLAVLDLRAAEGNVGPTAALVRVTLSPASSSLVSVEWSTADGTATAPLDYAAAGGSLIFEPGVTEMTLPMTLEGDDTVEGDEVLLLRLSNPSGASLRDGEGAVTIANDDSVSVAAEIESPAPGSIIPRRTTFSWSAGSGVTAYWLSIGTSPGGSNVYSASQGMNRSVTVSRLPRNRTLYVRLRSRINGAWIDRDYTYRTVS